MQKNIKKLNKINLKSNTSKVVNGIKTIHHEQASYNYIS